MAKKKADEEADSSAPTAEKAVKSEKAEKPEKTEKAEKAEKAPKKGTESDVTEKPDLDVKVDKNEKVETITLSRKLNKKYGKVATIDIKQRDPYIPKGIETKLREEIKKMRAVTPNELAARYDIRVSAMKKLLLDMEREGLVECVCHADRVKVFNGKNS